MISLTRRKIFFGLSYLSFRNQRQRIHMEGAITEITLEPSRSSFTLSADAGSWKPDAFCLFERTWCHGGGHEEALSSGHREHTILLSRERVNKGTKRMNNLLLSPVVISYSTCRENRYLDLNTENGDNSLPKQFERTPKSRLNLQTSLLSRNQTKTNAVGRFFYNVLGRICFRYFQGSRKILGSFAKFFLFFFFCFFFFVFTNRFSQYDRTVI